MTNQKQKPTTRRIVNETFHYALFVRVGGTKESAIRFFERKFRPDGGDTRAQASAIGSVIFADYERSHVCWLSDEANLGVVAHEALHSVSHVMRHAGVGPMCEQNEEAYAYLLQWTVNGIMGVRG